MIQFIRFILPGRLVVPVNAIFDSVILMTSEPVVKVEDVVFKRRDEFGGELVCFQNVQTKIHFILNRNGGDEKSTVNLVGVRAAE